MFTKAIVRPPAANFSEGLTTAELGVPDYQLALEQHGYYCTALESCGIELIRLEPDERYPDSCFVEDAALIIQQVLKTDEGVRVPGDHSAIITRPGALSRRGEVESLRGQFSNLFSTIHEIRAPGTVDGGDVCEAGTHFFIGISERTNEDGARQLARLLAGSGFTHDVVDIRGISGLLHLKSGLASLGDGTLIVTEALANLKQFRGYNLIRVDAGEEYAANCIEVNGRVLMAAGFPRFEAKLRDELDYDTVSLDMSEFEKMDGGLSCLSLRWGEKGVDSRQ
jgi:dimethylargininase